MREGATNQAVEPFGPGDLLWEGAGEYRILLVLPGALVMQVMHPAIGAAVAATGEYRTDPWGRLRRSLASLQTWVYGGPAALEEGRRLRRLHRSFTGVDVQGRPYRALDPEPWAWVHLTAHERAVTLHRVFAADRALDEARLYEEIRRLGRILRVPERMLPPTVEDYWRYFDWMVTTRLEPHPVALELLETMDRTPPPDLLPPPLRALWRPVGWSTGRLLRFVTIGTLPPAVRRILGCPWSAADERRLARLGRVVSAATARLPETLRYMPIARRARREARRAARAG
jgi:uncharacterized protein (DUF2236 family)